MIKQKNLPSGRFFCTDEGEEPFCGVNSRWDDQDPNYNVGGAALPNHYNFYIVVMHKTHSKEKFLHV